MRYSHLSGALSAGTDPVIMRKTDRRQEHVRKILSG